MPVDLTGVTSYYVRADGSDRNAGISEDAPFKTLQRAVLTPAKHDASILVITSSTVRLEYIELSGLKSTIHASALDAGGTVTLGLGAKITKNVSKGGTGIFAIRIYQGFGHRHRKQHGTGSAGHQFHI